MCIDRCPPCIIARIQESGTGVSGKFSVKLFIDNDRRRFLVLIEGVARNITSRVPIRVTVHLKQAYIGRYEDRIEFVFQDTQLQRSFLISRPLRATVGNRSEHEDLRPKAPYVPRARDSRPEPKEVVEGVKPPAITAVKYAVTLPHAVIPKHLRSVLSSPDSSKRISQIFQRMFMPRELDSDTYSKHFKHLLWIEELKME